MIEITRPTSTDISFFWPYIEQERHLFPPNSWPETTAQFAARWGVDVCPFVAREYANNLALLCLHNPEGAVAWVSSFILPAIRGALTLPILQAGVAHARKLGFTTLKTRCRKNHKAAQYVAHQLRFQRVAMDNVCIDYQLELA